MPTNLGPEELRARFNGIKKSLIYDEAVATHSKLRLHADGETPIILIKAARPNESDVVREYREKIYEPETQNPIERVIGLLEKIRRSPDWMMRFDNEVPAIINKDETLEKYLTENYPVYGDIEYWLFEEVLRNLSLDANGVVAVLPKDFDADPNEYIKPAGQVFNSCNVIDFIAEEHAVLKSDELSSLLSPEQQAQRILSANSIKQTNSSYSGRYEPFTAGQVYYVITTAYYQKWETTPDGKYQLTKQFVHGLNKLPAFQLPGKFVKRVGQYTLKKTPLYPMAPHLNKAARESNDLDAGVVMHLFLQKWTINNNECKPCNGTGKTASADGPETCKSCKGSGIATGKSPFNELQIKPAAIGQTNVPVPPVGYVVLNPEILKLQNERIEQHIYRSLASVNMEHLAEAQLNQSGTAKQYDRDEVNNLIYTFATYLVSVANATVKLICELRYKGLVPNQKDLEKLLPIIPVPEKFDVINSSFLITEYQSAKTAGLNSIILAEMQKEISEKKFYANPDVVSFVQTVMDLDPFPDKTVEEKALMASQGIAANEDVILSNYISDFVKKAMEENENFNELKPDKKREILLEMAAKKVEALSTASQMKNDILNQEIPQKSNL